MTKPHERPVKPRTLDRRDRARQAVAQRKPWKLSEISKFDRGLHKNDPDQHPKALTKNILRRRPRPQLSGASWYAFVRHGAGSAKAQTAATTEILPRSLRGYADCRRHCRVAWSTFLDHASALTSCGLPPDPCSFQSTFNDRLE